MKNNNHSNLLKSIVSSPYFIIFLVYLMCHGVMIFISGTFWDDLCYETHDYSRFKEIALGTGRPEWLFLIPFAWSLPFNSYRIIVFLMYGLQAIIFYKILIKLSFFTEKDALCITLIYLSVPVNDSRLLLSVFSYSTGLSIFLLAVYFWISLNTLSIKNKTLFRIERLAVLLLFFLSFILNSLLFFYYLLFILIFVYNYIEFPDSSFSKRIIKTLRKSILENFDFFIIPIVFFIIKSILFPVYGAYSEYNLVTIHNLFSSILKTVINIPMILISVFKNYTNFVSSVKRVLLLFVVVSLIYNHTSSKKDTRNSTFLYLKMLMISFVVLFMSIFPYLTIGRECIATTGVDSRDSILVPFGVAFFIYSISGLQSIKFKKITYMFCIIFGCFHFNLWYFEYQKDYYSQLAFENKIDNYYINEHQNFLVINNSKTAIGGERFYSLSHNARHVFGNQKHFLLSGIHDIKYLKSDWLKQRAAFGMLDGIDEIDTNYVQLDGILFYNIDIPLKKLLKLKVKELLFKKTFDSEIQKLGILKLIPLTSEQSEIIIIENNKGELNEARLNQLIESKEFLFRK